MKISNVLDSKGRAVSTTHADAPIGVVTKRLRLERIGALVVLNDPGRVTGLVTERDIVEGLAEHGVELLQRVVSAIMRRSVTTCRSGDDVKHVMALMTRHRVRHVPVVDDGELAGLVSIGDLVKHQLDEAELEVNTMRDFARTH